MSSLETASAVFVGELEELGLAVGEELRVVAVNWLVAVLSACFEYVIAVSRCRAEAKRVLVPGDVFPDNDRLFLVEGSEIVMGLVCPDDTLAAECSETEI